MLESDIEGYFKKQCEIRGGEVRKVKWIGRSNAPDRLAGFPSKWLSKKREWKPPINMFIEFKAPGIKPRGSQLREHERMRKIGIRVEVVDSLERVNEIMKEFDDE